MKPAKEWTDKQPLGCDDCEHIAYVKQIQLDAIKEGMRRAANHVDDPFKTNRIKCGSSSYEIQQAILTAAEQLTEKDL